MKKTKERKYKFGNFQNHILIDFGGTYKILYCPSVVSLEVFPSSGIVSFVLPNDEQIKITRKNYKEILQVIYQFETCSGNCSINFHN